MKLSAFDPYLTFAKHGDEKQFYQPSGALTFDGWERCASQKEHSINELYILAKQAYDAIEGFESQEQFQSLIDEYASSIDSFKKSFIAACEVGKISVATTAGEVLDCQEFENAESHEVIRNMLEIHHKVHEMNPTLATEDFNGQIQYLAICYLFAAFENIDHALIDIMINDDGVGGAIIAANCLSNFLIYSKAEINVQEMRSKMAKEAAQMRIKNDPKQHEKQFIKECWQQWQADSGLYKSKAAFARDMMNKVEHLTSSKKIEDWCREWEKETTTQLAK